MAKFYKLFAILVYLLLIVIGAISCFFAWWLLSNQNWHLLIVGNRIITVTGWFIAAFGITLFFSSIFGCIGSFKESLICLIIFVTIMLLLAAGFIFSGVVLSRNKNQVLNTVGSVTDEPFTKYGEDKELTLTWNELQVTYRCCAPNGPLDYGSTKWYNKPTSEFPKNGAVPNSCCVWDTDRGGYKNLTTCMSKTPVSENSYIYQEGCWSKLKPTVDNIIYWTKVACFIFAGFVIFAAIFGIYGNCLVRRSVRYGQVV